MISFHSEYTLIHFNQYCIKLPVWLSTLPFVRSHTHKFITYNNVQWRTVTYNDWLLMEPFSVENFPSVVAHVAAISACMVVKTSLCSYLSQICCKITLRIDMKVLMTCHYDKRTELEPIIYSWWNCSFIGCNTGFRNNMESSPFHLWWKGSLLLKVWHACVASITIQVYCTQQSNENRVKHVYSHNSFHSNRLYRLQTNNRPTTTHWAIIKVPGHQYRWSAGGYDLEIGHL